MRNIGLQSLFLSTVLTVAGCASTATGVSRSSMQGPAAPQTLKTVAPKGTVMAVLRYPAAVSTEAQTAYRQAYIQTPIGGRLSANAINSSDNQNFADSTIVKSNYFALSLFKELAARLPEHSVLLSPHEIILADDDSLSSRPITQAESIPGLVSIDFTTYSFPDAKKMMGSEPLTFGDLVTPLVVVRSDHRAAAQTQGVLLASNPLRGAAAGSGRAEAEITATAISKGTFDTDPAELDFIRYLSGEPTYAIPSQPLRINAGKGAAQAYGVEKIKLSAETLESLASGTRVAASGVIDPLENVFSAGFAERIVDILNHTDTDKAAMMQRAAAISQFDPNLAALTFVGTPETDYQSRYRYAERLLEAEQKYLSVQSLRIFDGIHNGEMGAQVRDMLKAEYDVLEKRRKLAKQQNQMAALAVLGAIAAGAAISQDNGNSYGQRILTDALISGSIFAGMEAYSKGKLSSAIGSNYLNSIVPALEEQISVQVDLIDSNETITAIRFEDLRDKLQTLYSNNQRSLDTVATRCAYTHDGTSMSGSWMGVCKGGLANGSGAGVIRAADGSISEYYGYAKNGQPHGPGYMITHGAQSTMSLEGNFTNGKADGAIKVSKAGKNIQNRLYAAGSDIGSAPLGDIPASPFGSVPKYAGLN